MSRRVPQVCRRIPVAALLLPLLVFRALIPGGLMPMLGADGTLGLQLCPGVTAEMPTHPHHAHTAETGGSMSHDHEGTGGPAGAHQNVCPFAVLATAACSSPDVASATYARHHAIETSRDVAQVTVTTLTRSQSPRAPPRHS